MPRWRQDAETGELIRIDGQNQQGSGRHAVHGDLQPFRSPIDGTVIADRKQYREHCKKHGVVNAAEFSPEFYERKAKERARFFTGEHTTEETFRRKQEIHEIITRLERDG